MSGLPLCRAVPLVHPHHQRGHRGVPPSLQHSMVPVTWLVTPRIPRNAGDVLAAHCCQCQPQVQYSIQQVNICQKWFRCCPFRGGRGDACWGEERRACPGVSGLGYPRKAPSLQPVGSGVSARQRGWEAERRRQEQHQALGPQGTLGLALSIPQGFPAPCSRQEHRHLLPGCVAG